MPDLLPDLLRGPVPLTRFREFSDMVAMPYGLSHRPTYRFATVYQDPERPILLAPLRVQVLRAEVYSDDLASDELHFKGMAEVLDRGDSDRRTSTTLRTAHCLPRIWPKEWDNHRRALEGVRHALKGMMCHEVDECIVDARGRPYNDPHAEDYDGEIPGNL